ncbi:hypothetical protein [Erythrobacter mangrovi]|uniref:Uncharacterized protein n=1 Tax=Erythrobacter mangrovi TaxID=2739433 RepID=A0A7D3XB42_9SPHN|nr:hypothetical protein [Erythrobacter mangrovi]QKG72295.1 hypothetical protein HQR01_13480 [Erythrobacter mangrovi]
MHAGHIIFDLTAAEAADLRVTLVEGNCGITEALKRDPRTEVFITTSPLVESMQGHRNSSADG